jgi:hypothetical protein
VLSQEDLYRIAQPVGANPDAPTVTLTAAEYHAMRRREMLAAVAQRLPEHEAIAAERVRMGGATDAGGTGHRPGRLTCGGSRSAAVEGAPR